MELCWNRKRLAIRAWRGAHDKSAREVAAMVGLDPNTWSSMERGAGVEPGAELTRRINAALTLPNALMCDLLGGILADEIVCGADVQRWLDAQYGPDNARA